jgi:hypothetical protein
MCDRFGDSCGANEAAKAACVTATAATKDKTGQAAGMFTLLSRCSHSAPLHPFLALRLYFWRKGVRNFHAWQTSSFAEFH